MHVLGIDPGLANCGWGIIAVCGSSLSALAYGNISTTPNESLPTRLGTLFNEVKTVIARYQPSELGIETVYHKGNSKSALATAQARGAVLAAASTLELAVGEYAPTVIKKSVVGTGTATKEQVQYMVRVVLGLDHTPTPDHAADALAAAICHAHWRTNAREVPLND
jgi:crossover junction endodeoxyribonuclease RuvC